MKIKWILSLLYYLNLVWHNMPNTYINATTSLSNYPLRRLMVKVFAKVDKPAVEWTPHRNVILSLKQSLHTRV